MHLSRDLVRTAESQAGVLHRSQLLEGGMAVYSIPRLVARGLLTVMHPNVYLVAGAPLTWQARLIAAQLWAGEDAFFSHRTAAMIYGLDGITSSVIEITLTSGRRTPGVLAHRIRPEDRPRLRQLKGLRVASVERVILDLCAVTSFRPGGLAMDDALRKRLTTVERLRDEARAVGRGRTGATSFKELVALRDERDERLRSRMEAKLLAVLKRTPGRPVTGFCVPVGGRRYYLDFAFPEARLGVECHGLRWHFGEERWKRDLARDRHLSLDGWTMLYYVWDDIQFAPETIASEVTQAYLKRNPPLVAL